MCESSEQSVAGDGLPSARKNIYDPPPSHAAPKLAKQAAGWVIFLTIMRQVISVAATMVVSRHVTPADYGVAAMVLSFLAFLTLLDTAMTWATVQAPEFNQDKYNALFFIEVLIGVVLLLVASAIGPLLAKFYGVENLSVLCIFIGTVAFFNSVTTQPAALLRRQLRQKLLNAIETVVLIISNGLGVGLALMGYGVWAILWQTFCMYALRAILTFYMSGFVPKWPSNLLVVVPELWKGTGFALSNYICYIQLYLGGILAGRYFGSVALGNYQRAYTVKSLPTQYASMIATDVMVSSLAAMKSVPDKMAEFYRKALVASAIIGCPAGAFLFSAAREVIYILYGPQWNEAVPLLRSYSIAALALPISTSTIWLFLAAGKAKEQLKMNLVLSLLSLVTLIPVAIFVRNIGVLVLVETILFVLPYLALNLVWSHRALGIALRPTLNSIKYIIIGSLVAVVISEVTGAYITQINWLSFGVKSTVFFATYMFVVIKTIKPFPVPIIERVRLKLTQRKFNI